MNTHLYQKLQQQVGSSIETGFHIGSGRISGSIVAINDQCVDVGVNAASGVPYAGRTVRIPLSSILALDWAGQ